MPRLPSPHTRYTGSSHGTVYAMDGCMNLYTDAPATDLLATRCAACGRPLLDAVSVEIGMGPVCRERAGLDGAGTGADWPAVVALLAGTGIDLSAADARRTANRVVHRIAADQGASDVPVLLGALTALGFDGVASAVRDHLDVKVPAVEVTAAEGNRLDVTLKGLDTETFNAVVCALRGVPGRRWDAERKVNVIPTAAKRALWNALASTLPAGAQIRGAKGVHTVAPRAAA